LLAVDVPVGGEVPDLAGEARGELGGVEAVDGADAALPGEQAVVVGVDVVPEHGDEPHARDHHPLAGVRLPARRRGRADGDTALEAASPPRRGGRGGGRGGGRDEEAPHGGGEGWRRRERRRRWKRGGVPLAVVCGPRDGVCMAGGWGRGPRVRYPYGPGETRRAVLLFFLDGKGLPLLFGNLRFYGVLQIPFEPFLCNVLVL
jgi:hypothetical protein